MNLERAEFVSADLSMLKSVELTFISIKKVLKLGYFFVELDYSSEKRESIFIVNVKNTLLCL